MRKAHFRNYLLALLLASVTLFSCRQDSAFDDIPDDLTEEEFLRTADFPNTVAVEWMTLYLDIERFTPGYRPTVSGRTAAYVGLAGYEAVLPGMSDKFNSLVGQIPGLELPTIDPDLEYHWPTCLHSAYGAMMTHLFPTAPALQQQKLFTLKQKYFNRFSSEIPIDVFNRSEKFGADVANAIFTWSETDVVGHQSFLRNNDPGYVPPVFEGSWQPTYPDFTPALTPYWGQVRTFAANNDDNVPPPIPFSTDPNSLFYGQAKETMVLVNLLKAGQNQEDYWIADFWSDDCPILTFTPAGRWIAVACQVVVNEKVSLDIAAYTYAKVGIGLNDAGVRCWNEKYRYNLIRPVDYIQSYMDESWNTVMCPDGSGTYYTPPFPAYPSGHATFGAVSAEVLTEIFGFNHEMTDRCHEGRTEFQSTPRSFGSFYEMAQENAYSRIPIGVHFRMDSEAGLELGYKIGRKINNLSWRK